jgi:hypothetical protein
MVPAALHARQRASMWSKVNREKVEVAGLAKEFAALDSRNRYAILHRLQTVKRPGDAGAADREVRRDARRRRPALLKGAFS